MPHAIDAIHIIINARITPEQLFDFYFRNNICEKEFGMEQAARVLERSSLIVGTFEGERLVGLARAMFDGNDAAVMELSLDLEYQGGQPKHHNGSLIEHDELGLGKRLGEVFISRLTQMDATFIYIYIVQDCEEAFHESIGFKHNKGHLLIT